MALMFVFPLDVLVIRERELRRFPFSPFYHNSSCSLGQEIKEWILPKYIKHIDTDNSVVIARGEGGWEEGWVGKGGMEREQKDVLLGGMSKQCSVQVMFY